MSDTFARIEKLENGYTVCVTDRKIEAENRKPRSMYKSAQKEYAFKDLKSALKWIADNEASLAPSDDDSGSAYTGAWNEAVSTKG